MRHVLNWLLVREVLPFLFIGSLMSFLCFGGMYFIFKPKVIDLGKQTEIRVPAHTIMKYVWGKGWLIESGTDVNITNKGSTDVTVAIEFILRDKDPEMERHPISKRVLHPGDQLEMSADPLSFKGVYILLK